MLGCGLAYRAEIADHIRAARADIDFVEVATDQFATRPSRLDELRDIASMLPVAPHGTGLSIGSKGSIPREILERVRLVSDITGSAYYSDHLCMTRVPGIDLGHLTPLWFCDEVLAAAVARIREAQDFLGKPLVLENITYAFTIPHGQMVETEFFNQLTAATGCGVLLDVTNLYINSINHHFDPIAYMNDMPLDHVVQVHLAGGEWRGSILADSHSHPVPEEVWELFSMLCRLTTVKGAIIERDGNLADFTSLIAEVSRARAILHGSRGC